MESFLRRYPRTITLRDGATVTLRPLRAEESEKLRRLFRDAPPEDVRALRDDVTNPDVIRRWVETLDYERDLPLMAEQGGEFVGEVTLYRHPRTAHPPVGQIRLFVRPDYRQRGLGSQLTSDVVELARDLGLEQLVVELYLDDAPLISAFERRGFEREAILSVYRMVVMRYDLARRPGSVVLEIDHADKLPPRGYWPDLVFDESLMTIPETINLSELLDHVVENGWGERPAIFYRDEVVSYELLLSEVRRLASSLSRLGIKAGDPVLLHLPNTPQAIASNFAVQRLGALSVPTPPQFSVHELEFLVRESGVVAAITTADLLDDVLRVRDAAEGRMGPVVAEGIKEAVQAEQLYRYATLVARGDPTFPVTPRRREEIALLLYTSADSGHPRGTAHRLDGLLAAVQSFGGRVWRINEEDVI
ncbi:MAG: GNAT family N-acetyltransferase, partial [Ardenticatenaceae bacterium]